MMKRLKHRRRKEYEMAQDIHERLDKARSFAKDNVGRAREGVKHGIERAGERTRAVGSVASEKLTRSRARADKALTESSDVITKHPLASVAAAVTVGALAAYFLPRSVRGVRKLGPKAAALALAAKREASEAARSGVAATRNMASTGVNATRNMANAGINATRNLATSSLEATRDIAEELSDQVETHLHPDVLREQAGTARARAARTMSRVGNRFSRK